MEMDNAHMRSQRGNGATTKAKEVTSDAGISPSITDVPQTPHRHFAQTKDYRQAKTVLLVSSALPAECVDARRGQPWQ